jgi:hypothetical protein
LLDGIAKALENEATIDLVFGVLMLQVPNLQQARRQHGGSLPSRSPNVAQERKVNHNKIVQDYFIKHSIYNNWLFHH